MSRKLCENCYFYELCLQDSGQGENIEVCEDYYSINGLEDDEDELERLVERGREDYRSAWNIYIKEMID